MPSKSDIRSVLSCWRGYIQGDPNVVFEVHLALGAKVCGRSFHQARAHPNGRKVFQQKPDILAKLRDDAYLATLPVGSVGHAYREFLATNRLDAGIYDEDSIVRPLAEKYNWHEDYYYYIMRATALHDVVHVLTGYGPDLAGEVIAIGFTCGQMEPAAPLRQIGYGMAAVVPGASIQHKLRVYRQALERGRRADKLTVAPWEELLDRPLGRVRDLLGVTPAAQAHPQGTWYSTWTPRGAEPLNRWNYDEVFTSETT
ncbi:Coq4 family protein [Mycobacterium sp. LTG2003]